MAWHDIPSEAWLSFFKQQLTPATAGALLWFSAIYRELSEAERVAVYGAVHTLTHAQFLQHVNLLNRLTRTQGVNKHLQAKYRALQIQRRHELQSFQELERQYASSQKETQALQAELRLLRQHIAPPEELQVECDALRAKLQRAEEKLHTRTATIQEVKGERDQLRQQLKDHQAFVENMQAELAKLFDQFAQADAAQHCPNFALCNRRILIVGGLTKLRVFYEQLVTRMGGQFEYHDGDQCQGVESLSYLVERNDVIICPVDVNSHSACLHVKKCCKELKKPYYMLRSSSLSAIHSTLAEVARTTEKQAVA